MQVKPALSIDEPANSESGDNATHAQQRRANPVATDTVDPLFGRHYLWPVVEIQAEEVDWRADKLDGRWNRELRDQNLEVFLGGDGVWDRC